ncbi:MAG: ABC transporter substrate-binding protein [Marinicaulis sp.]|nr:ABC transporter substrate-binding protein [Marinicaulis sp.]
MFSLKNFRSICVGAFAAAALSSPTVALADEPAESYIGAILVEAEPVLNAETEDAVLDGIADLVDKHVDMRRVALFTLGQYARQMTAEQREEYLPLFKQYATIVYQNALSNYSGQRLEVTGSIDRSERDIIVNSKLADPNPGDPFADAVIQWRVYRSKDGDMAVVDAGADNVWLAIEQRSQFTSVIANNGGGATGIDALIAQMRKQVGG